MKPHKHANLIKAWADGAEIQFYDEHNQWKDCLDNSPFWEEKQAYRIKPQPKEVTVYVYEYPCDFGFSDKHRGDNYGAKNVYKKTITLTEDDKI